jgi:hypothetical protein
MKYKFLHGIAYFTFFMALSLMCYFSYMLFYPFKTVDLYNGNYKTTKLIYKQGEILTLKLNYHKYINKPATVVRSFYNDLIYTLPTIETNNPMGTNECVSGLTSIPKELPPGKYTFKSNVTFKINSFRNISIDMETNEFEVIKG